MAQRTILSDMMEHEPEDMDERMGVVQKALDKAITLHKQHMADPKTADMASQKVLMDLIMTARKNLDMDTKTKGGM